jgi:hypothetical protein
MVSHRDDVCRSVIVAGVWTWLRSYRVWLANAKAFIWPENWLKPENGTPTRRRRRRPDDSP